ncbi:MAG: aminotransferase class I/II-fold pyridoxal phosphate-dependent enzyme [Chitinophagaceae bacterium]|nr:aminotransferase class I/II-fold pyridoxal phosphate-dependent enzyme [Chitinophagaceae bacterium]
MHSKLPHVGTTIFTTMSTLAAQYNAVNLGQGFPDFMMSEELIRLVNAAMQHGNNQYSHMSGLPLLRERIAQKAQTLYGTVINPETEITITPGGTYAIYTALTTVLQPGDEVIVFEPAFDSYLPNIEINGAVPVLIPLSFPGYSVDWDLVRQKISPKTKMIMINTPHNPTGSVLGKNDIEQLRSVVKDTGIFILSDEVYEHLIFDDVQHESILRYPDLLARSFVCFSFGKTYHCTGWKMGYCIAPALLMNEYRKVHQFNCFCCSHPVQHALAEFMLQPQQYLQLGKMLQQKRDPFQQLMLHTKFKALPSYGSYFQLYRYDDISDETEKEFATRLTREYGVTAIPVSVFYNNETDNKVLRFCFAKKEATLEEAVTRLLKL